MIKLNRVTHGHNVDYVVAETGEVLMHAELEYTTDPGAYERAMARIKAAEPVMREQIAKPLADLEAALARLTAQHHSA